ncbi:uncharacterized protein JCM10292_000223 [Rhodotorula paludigena]|uniref:uncharacterized protein n=1 Tax=Rhodotorula paludigena TaxID=86838 RepID=UPI00316B2936
MNHLYHSLAPLILFAAFLVSLLAFLAPTHILHDRVSLLEVKTNATRSSSSKRWLVHEPPTLPHNKMVKRAKSSGAAQVTTVPVTVSIGPLGACYTNLTTSEQTCTTPSLTPIFVDVYDNVRLPDTIADALPDYFPLVPTGILISLGLMGLQLVAVLASSVSMHASKKLAFMNKKQPTLRKAAMFMGLVSLLIGMVAVTALRVQLGNAADKAGKTDGVEAKLGSGFNQLFAGLVLQAVAVALLVSEAITSK